MIHMNLIFFPPCFFTKSTAASAEPPVASIGSTITEIRSSIASGSLLGNKGSFLIQKMNDKLVEHKQYIAEYGQDLEEIRNWEWHK